MISIIIPSAGQRFFLLQTLESVKSQSFNDFECIVVADDRAEQPPEDCKHIFKLPQFRWVAREGKSGGCGARNQGLHLAAGEWIMFLDDDDLLESNCLALRCESIEFDSSKDFYVSPGLRFKEEPGDQREFHVFPYETNDSDLERMFLFQSPWITTGPTWRRDFLLELGGWNENLSFWQDWELNLRALSISSNYKRNLIPDYYWRLPSQKNKSIGSTKRGVKQIKEVCHAIIPVIQKSSKEHSISVEIECCAYIEILRLINSVESSREILKCLTQYGLLTKLERFGFKKYDVIKLLYLRLLKKIGGEEKLKNWLFKNWEPIWRR